MDVEELRLEALKLAWYGEERASGATYAQPAAKVVIERAQAYLAFLEGKIPDTVSQRIVDVLNVSPEWIKAAQKYVREHPPQRAARKGTRRHR